MEETSVPAGDNVQLTYLLDNVSCYRRAAEAMIPEHHVVRHLPEYSPILNIFSVWKSQLKRELAKVHPLLVQQPHEEQLATLGQLSKQALAAVTVRKCIEWFQGIRHLIPKYLQQEDRDHWRITPKCFAFELIYYNYLECNLPFSKFSFVAYRCSFYNCCAFCRY